MKRNKMRLGVFNLCFNSSFKYVCIVIALGLALQGLMFAFGMAGGTLGYLPYENDAHYPDSFEWIVRTSHLAWAYRGMLAALMAVLFGTGRPGKSHPVMVIERTGISHEQFMLTEFFYSWGCFFLSNIIETIFLLGLALVYINIVPGVDLKLVYAAAIRCPLLYSLVMPHNGLGMLWRACHTFFMAFLAAYYSYIERRGGMPVAVIIAAVFTVFVAVPGALGTDDEILTLSAMAMCVATLLFGAYILEGVHMEYEKK
ncbi:MAG: hypothetical protein K6G40_04765 [Eubacterium sp.]|nr:hypothetical protein [Eubacterium sp.]